MDAEFGDRAPSLTADLVLGALGDRTADEAITERGQHPVQGRDADAELLGQLAGSHCRTPAEHGGELITGGFVSRAHAPL